MGNVPHGTYDCVTAASLCGRALNPMHFQAAYPQQQHTPLPPYDENARLAALDEYKVFDTESEQSFDDLTELAAFICDAPVSLVSLVGRDRQFFKAARNLDIRETSREISFCAHALRSSDPMMVPDATQDHRFTDNPFVTPNDGVRFYAGAPIVNPNGQVLGTVCVIDYQPRTLETAQLKALQALARQATLLLEHRRLNALHEATSEILNKATTRLNLALDAGDFGTFTWALETGRFAWENDQMYKLFGRPRSQGPLTVTMLSEKIVQPQDRDAFSEATASIEEEGDQLEWSGEILGGDGNIHWIQLRGIAELNQGNQLCVIGIAKGEANDGFAELN